MMPRPSRRGHPRTKLPGREGAFRSLSCGMPPGRLGLLAPSLQVAARGLEPPTRTAPFHSGLL